MFTGKCEMTTNQVYTPRGFFSFSLKSLEPEDEITMYVVETGRQPTGGNIGTISIPIGKFSSRVTRTNHFALSCYTRIARQLLGSMEATPLRIVIGPMVGPREESGVGGLSVPHQTQKSHRTTMAAAVDCGSLVHVPCPRII